MPELSSIRLNKKLFNNRLQNDPQNLKHQINGAKKDIKEITQLVQTLQRYRSSISDMKNQFAKQGNSVTPTTNTNTATAGTGTQMAEVSEGLLGRMPEGTESIAELMLFDSDINVYGESNVYIPEFDFRNRVTKNTSNTQKTSKKSQKDNL